MIFHPGSSVSASSPLTFYMANNCPKMKFKSLLKSNKSDLILSIVGKKKVDV